MYFLLVVFAILCDFSTRTCSIRHFGVNVVLGNYAGDKEFEEKSSAVRNLDILGSTYILPRYQKKETNLEDDKQAIKLETRTNHRAVLDSLPGNTEERIEPGEAGSICCGRGHVEVMDYAQPHRKPPIHNEDP